MAEKCSCGHVHCCHNKTKDKKTKDPETGLKFIRTACANPNCQKWLSDRPID